MSEAVTEATFDEQVLQSDKPVIVDFWAEWCGPCHAVPPVLEKIVEEHDASSSREGQHRRGAGAGLALRGHVHSDVILFRDGEPSAAVIGAQPKGAIERALGLGVAA